MKLTELVSFKTNLTEARGPMCWVVLGPDFKKDRTESQVFTKLDALCKEPQKFVSFEASTAADDSVEEADHLKSEAQAAVDKKDWRALVSLLEDREADIQVLEASLMG